MKYLTVWLTFPDGERLQVGELAIIGRQNTRQPGSAFRYAQAYLAHDKAFSLDPQFLPLSDEEFICDRSPEDIHSVFEDSLPDAWGRRLLAKRHGLAIKTSELATLLPYVSGNVIGALSYGEPNEQTPYATITDLGALTGAAELFEKGKDIDKEVQILFGAGSSPGGARPKALVVDGNEHYLAKFPSIHDRYNMVLLEAAVMTLAQQAGLDVCNVRVMKLASTPVLLVNRFDITTLGGRNHIVSMKTFVGDRFHVRYEDMVNIVRQYSDQPEIDLPMLFCQLCFNVFIGNTDDHIKNFSMMRSENGWRLTPAYDLLPNVGENPEHALQFLHTNYPPSQAGLLDIGVRLFGLSKKKTTNTISQVRDSMLDWIGVFKSHEVPASDISRLAKGINNSLDIR